MAYSSSSSSSSSSFNVPEIKHDVFISFRGEVRTSILSHLIRRLKDEGIGYYLDEENLPAGSEISPTLLQAIEQSSISVVLFSEHYASSRWCMDELVKIIECMELYQRSVIPVFYNVDPSHVRHQKGTFKEDFDVHTKKYKENSAKVQNWRCALRKTADLSGIHYPSNFRNESEFIEKIVKDISKKLPYILSRESKGLVGIDDSIRSVESLLAIESNEVRIIGIWGMGGIGKTTVAQVLFDKYSSHYEGSCMLKNVRERSQMSGMVDLCDKLESKLLAGESGSSQRKLSQKKVFIVLDDVDTLQKFEDLTSLSLGSGSRIIVTTRDEHVLTNVHHTYKVKGLDFENSLKLFCLRAFEKVYPEVQFEEVSEKAVNYANGIPLALKVLGSYLRPKKTIEEWKSALGKLKIYPNKDIFDVLKLSYEGLDELERSIFLDIVFFFRGKDKDAVIPFLESCNFFPADGIGNLCRKALITISEDNEIEMHDLIEQMGREIVHRESINDPGRKDPGSRSRLSDNEDVYEVLHHNEGTKSVEGIMLDMCEIKRDIHLDGDTFKKMPKIRFLKFYYSSRCKRSANIYVSSTLESFPNKLGYLEWSGCPVKSLPPNFCAEKLVELRMPDSQVSKLWDGVQDLVNLKKIDLSGCKQLVELPDFTHASNLKDVYLSYCVRLCKLPPSILSIHKLETLFLDGCEALESLQSDIHLKSLETINVFGCSGLNEFGVSSEEITRLDLSGTLIKMLHSSVVGRLSNLVQLNLRDLRVETLPNALCHLVTLEELNLKGCKQLIELPDNMKALSRLCYLDITDCSSLRSLPELPQSILRLYARNCTSLETLFKAETVFSLNAVCMLFKNCERLDEHSFVKYVHHTMMGVAIRDLLDWMLQDNTARVSTLTFFPEPGPRAGVYYSGSKVPSWFKYQRGESWVTVDLGADQPHYRDSVVGFIVCCVVHHIPRPQTGAHGKRVPLIRCSYDFGHIEMSAEMWGLSSDHVYISFGQVYPPHELHDENNNVTFKFKTYWRIWEWEVIGCGVCPVYASNILQVFQNVDPKFQFFYDMARPNRLGQPVFTLGEVKSEMIRTIEAQQNELLSTHSYPFHPIQIPEEELEKISFEELEKILFHKIHPAPAPHVFKINCHAILLNEEQLAGFGCIIRDSSGNWIKGCSGAIPFSDGFHCQLFAIWRGLTLAWECGCENVVCETDCDEVVLLLSVKDFPLCWDITYELSRVLDGDDLVAKIEDVLLWDWTAIVSYIQPRADTTATLMAEKSAREQHGYIEWLQQ